MRRDAKIITLGAALFLAGACAQAQTIAEWDFDGVGTQAAPYNSPTPSKGAGTATVLGMNNDYNDGASPSLPYADVLATAGASTGSGSYGWRIRGGSVAGGAGTPNGWSTNAPIATQGAEFLVSTVGYNDIGVSFDLYTTSAAEANVAIEYTLNGGVTWTDVSSITYSGSLSTQVSNNTTSANTIQGIYLNLKQSGGGWYNDIIVGIPASAANESGFGIEIVNASTGTADINQTGGVYNNSSGNCRLDNVLISGSPLPQSTQFIYSNALVNGWGNASYDTTLNYANTSPVSPGSEDSVSATITSAYGGMGVSHAAMSDSAYTSISFLLNGGATGGQNLQMYATLGGVSQSPYPLTAPQANTWQQYWVPLSALGVANAANLTGFVIQDSAGTSEPTFYLDDIQLTSEVAPPLTPLTVNASQPIRTADARWFGLNTAVWDSYLDTPDTVTLMTNMGVQALMYPGGSDSDIYHWVSNGLVGGGSGSSSASLASFIQVITNIGGETMITMNYGTGTSNEAAAWVAYVNAATTSTVSLGVDQYGINWQTAGYWASLRAAAPLGTDDGKNFLRISRTAPLGFKYWEIGNEVYGASWETDSNVVAHDPYTYAMRSCGYIALCKAVDPTVKIGVVVETGEDSYVNNTDHEVTNPVTGVGHYGWTPVLLATLKSQGVTPDFAIFHNYPENPGGESDAGLLASSGSSSGWAYDAANLRMMLTDYMGTTGTNTELVCTENNSVSSSPGKQSVSLVNGLYKMDSLGQLMQTEFNGLFWWDLRNGQETGNNNSASLYGWREYGDYGVVNADSDLGETDLYPTYYVTELMTDFAQEGDTVVAAASTYSLLPVYAVQRQDGRLTALVINKDPVHTLAGELVVTGYTPASGGVVYSYGIPQDQAVENDLGSPNAAQTGLSVTGTNISYSFPPYSATVIALSPGPATLLAISQSPSQFVLQLQGQPNVPYIVESSTNLITWTPVSTNTPLSNALNITNSVSPSQPGQFWRVVWQP